MLQQKFDAFEAFKHFKTLAELEKGMKIKMLKTDRGGDVIRLMPGSRGSCYNTGSSSNA